MVNLVAHSVLDDKVHSMYEDVQDVGHDVWNTNSYQRENALILSDQSEADTSPRLIINDHDTKTSHTVSIEQVDAKDLFYMVSRFVLEEQARSMPVEGFFMPVPEEVEVGKLRDDPGEFIAARLR